MQEPDVLAFFGTERWRTARSKLNPHEYIARHKVALAPEEFDALVIFLRKNGEPRGWGRKTYIVWYAPDGYHYWTMGWPVRETVIINRAHTATQDQTYDAKDGEVFSSPSGFRPEYA